MLVLSRKPDQTVFIGDSIKVTVVRVRGNVVTLGIDAPKSVRVLREEISGREAKPTSQTADQGSASPQIPEHPVSEHATQDPPCNTQDSAPLADLEDMLYEPEDYATRNAFSSPLAQYMFAP